MSENDLAGHLEEACRHATGMSVARVNGEPHLLFEDGARAGRAQDAGRRIQADTVRGRQGNQGGGTTMMRSRDAEPRIPLSEVVNMSRKAPCLGQHRARLAGCHGGYIPNASATTAIELFSAGLGKGATLSIVGPYGSGKSTFGVVLSRLAAPRGNAGWKAAYGILRQAPRTRQPSWWPTGGGRACTSAAWYGASPPPGWSRWRRPSCGQQPAAPHHTLGRHTDAGTLPKRGTLRRCAKSLQRGTVPDAATVSGIIASLAKSVPVLLVIDEFGKNIEYFAGGGGDGDLFLLQDLAEMSGASRGVPLHIVTMQHMAFGEYVAGTPAARTKEWAKIQGRFEIVHFANSLEHTRALLAASLRHNAETNSRIMEWAVQHTGTASREAGTTVPAEIAASCYPLHPLAVEALPELCSRYGQNDRTLLSFVFGSGPGTIARFIENEVWDGRGALPTMGADHLYDYFISGSAPSRAGTSSSRLVEIDTIIRDARLTDETERSVLKAIGLMNLIGRSGRLRASIGTIRSLVGEGTERAVRGLESRSIITYRRHADEYRVWHGTDVNIAAKMDAWKKAMLNMPHPALMKAAMDPDPVVAAKHGIETGTVRVFECLFEMPGDGIGQEYDGAIIYGTIDTAIPSSDRPVLVSRRMDVTAWQRQPPRWPPCAPS